MYLARAFASTALAVVLALPLSASPQDIQWQQPQPVPQPAPDQAAPPAAPVASPAQLDQMLAPIALYPDQLLGQILMAATYPLEVVEADRWVKDPANAALKGDQLSAALTTIDWDPSVKSLVPFPQILAMMDDRLEWTRKLGDAFLAQQADVMDSVQRLRRQAQAAGNLQSTPQQAVIPQGQAIVIQPANPSVVYVPVYNPTVVYGPWPYPAYPPVYLPPPPGFYFGPAVVAGIGFSIGFGIVRTFWDWDDCDWDHRRVRVNVTRVNVINNFFIQDSRHPPIRDDRWVHDPFHRRGVVYQNPQVRAEFRTAPRGAPDSRRDFRGFDRGGPAPRMAPRTADPRPAEIRPDPRPGPPAVQPSARAPQGRIEADRRGPERASPQRQVQQPTPPQATVQQPAAHGPQGRVEGAQRPQVAAPAKPQVTAPARPTMQPPDRMLQGRIDSGQRGPETAPQMRQAQRVPMPAFEGVNRGAEVRAQAERGRASQMAAQRPPFAAPRPEAAPRAAQPQAQPQAARPGGGHPPANARRGPSADDPRQQQQRQQQ